MEQNVCFLLDLTKNTFSSRSEEGRTKGTKGKIKFFLITLNIHGTIIEEIDIVGRCAYSTDYLQAAELTDVITNPSNTISMHLPEIMFLNKHCLLHFKIKGNIIIIIIIIHTESFCSKKAAWSQSCLIFWLLVYRHSSLTNISQMMILTKAMGPLILSYHFISMPPTLFSLFI